jgi:hypothetical protein
MNIARVCPSGSDFIISSIDAPDFRFGYNLRVRVLIPTRKPKLELQLASLIETFWRKIALEEWELSSIP